MKKLLTSGASWTSGYPLTSNLSWPTIVSNSLDYNLVDVSRSASSNYRIYRKAFDNMLYYKPDLSLIFWTTWTRFETGAMYGKKPGRIYQHLAGNNESKKAFKLFFNGYLQYTDTLRQIISIQTLAKQNKKPCYHICNFDLKKKQLFESITLEEFKEVLNYNPLLFYNMDDDRIESKFCSIKKLESMVDWSKFITTQPYKNLYESFPLFEGHPTDQGQEIIASMIIDFIKNH